MRETLAGEHSKGCGWCKKERRYGPDVGLGDYSLVRRYLQLLRISASRHWILDREFS